MRYWFRIGVLMIISAVFSACEDEIDKSGSLPEAQTKQVTYLLYMVGQNDLKEYLNENIRDLKVGFGKTDIDANILVYADISSMPSLYLIGKDISGKVQQMLVKTYPDQFSVDPDVMRCVINEVFSMYPADKKGITFSSHADGSLYTDRTINKRSFGSEGSQRYGMNVTDIREVLDGCPDMDLVMFDACMMASVETAYELKNNTHYLLAAPNTVPAEGFPYDRILPYLLQMDEVGIVSAAQDYMKYFEENENEWDDFVAVSVTDVSRIDLLALYMDSLFQDVAVQEIPSLLNRTELQLFERNYPLYDYLHWVDSLGRSNRFVQKIRRELDNIVVYKAHGEYSSVNNYTGLLEIPVRNETFCGLNTYVPSNYSINEKGDMQFFTTLKWYRDAGFWRVPFYKLHEKNGC